jgi:hypothetical protein
VHYVLGSGVLEFIWKATWIKEVGYGSLIKLLDAARLASFSIAPSVACISYALSTHGAANEFLCNPANAKSQVATGGVWCLYYHHLKVSSTRPASHSKAYVLYSIPLPKYYQDATRSQLEISRNSNI